MSFAKYSARHDFSFFYCTVIAWENCELSLFLRCLKCVPPFIDVYVDEHCDADEVSESVTSKPRKSKAANGESVM